MTRRLIYLALSLALSAPFAGCARRDRSAAGTEASKSKEALLGKPRCFDVTTREETASARAVFAAKRCQGGGVTWAGIARMLVARHGTLRPSKEPMPSWTGDVIELSRSGQTVRVSIDEEGDAARVCSDSGTLVDEVQRDVARLRADRAELEHLLASADPLAVECFPDGFSATVGLNPEPMPSPAEAHARSEGLARIRAALARERTWCWRKGGEIFGGKGGITLHEDHAATAFGDGPRPAHGRWSFEPDGRVEVVLPGELHHFDVAASGRLGFDHSAGREELDPCEPPAN